jgi:hypothetical protein
MASVRAVRDDPQNARIQRCFIVEGPGGVGKTLLNNAIIAALKAARLNVIPTAATGIASTLMTGGSTAHSAFCIPTDIDHNTPPRIEAHGPLAQRLKETDLIIIDEFSMFHRANLEYLDRALRDIFPQGSARSQLPFGGIPILLTGNWAQLAPVVPGANEGGRRDASIKMSPLLRHFQTFYLRENMRAGLGEAAFANLLLQIGYGRNFVNRDCIEIPEQCRSQSLDDLIAFCFPAELMLRPLENVELIKSHCILSPLRSTVAQLNDRIRCLIPEAYSPTEVLHALDHRVHAPTADDPTAVTAAQRDIEYIHNRTPSGFPPYELRLKVGMICVMNYNYDPRAHLFNGTRVQILQIQRNLLKVKVLTGTSDHIAYLGRRKFEYGRKRNEPGIPFTRTQYPLEPGFCMTVNKSQGQTLDRVGVDLTSRQCFSHGMLYTALSRVRSASSLRILSGLGDKAVNVVDMELIRGADVDLLNGDGLPPVPPALDDSPPPPQDDWSDDDVFT